MAQKVIVSKAGKDALNITDPNDALFHSDYNTFKILAEGKLTSQSIDANPKTITVAHNQGVIPGVYAFAKFPDGFVTVPTGKERADAYPVDRYFLVEVDATNIYFIFYKGTLANYSVDIKYYIFEVPL